jgi:hypothetical protein
MALRMAGSFSPSNFTAIRQNLTKNNQAIEISSGSRELEWWLL